MLQLDFTTIKINKNGTPIGIIWQTYGKCARTTKIFKKLKNPQKICGLVSKCGDYGFVNSIQLIYNYIRRNRLRTIIKLFLIMDFMIIKNYLCKGVGSIEEIMSRNIY